MWPAAVMACWYSRTIGRVELIGNGTTWLIATPVPSDPRARRLEGVASTDRAYICVPLRRWLVALMNSIVGLPAMPSNKASGSVANSFSEAVAASLALFSTDTASTGLSLRLAMASVAAANTSLPKALFWYAMPIFLIPSVVRCLTSSSISSA